MKRKDFYLYICGQRVKVTEEIYREYCRAKDKERYFLKRLKKGHIIAGADTGERRTFPGRELSLWIKSY